MTGLNADQWPPVEQCNVDDKVSLSKFRHCQQKWQRWMRTDPHHALWSQIYSMLLADMTYRSIAVAADADPGGALHSPIIRRAITEGYAAGQGLAIRRLVDMTKGTISLRRVLSDIGNKLEFMTRENVVCNAGGKFDDEFLAQIAFDRLAGISADKRKRTDRLPRRLINRIDGWLKHPDIKKVADWCSDRVAHSSDLAARGGAEDSVIDVTIVASAQRHIVRAAEAISVGLLNGPIHGAIIPVFQYSQFFRFEMVLADGAGLGAAQTQWSSMAAERDRWTDGVIDDLTG